MRLYVADLQARAAGRVRAIEVFGGYLDVDKLSDADRKLIEDFAKLMGNRLRKSTNLINRARANSEHKLLTSWSQRSC